MAITTFGVNERNDLYLADGSNLQILNGEAAVAQGVNQAVQQRTTENPFNINEGVDYLGSVFTPLPDFNLFRDDLTRTALSVPDTISVRSINLLKTGDKLSFEMTIATIYGNVALTGNV